MIREWAHHVAYQEGVRQKLAQFLARHDVNCELWKHELHVAWHVDLDALVPIVCDMYSTMGRPARDPAAMLRCLMLMHFCECKRITEWVARLHREPVLAITCGFDPDDLPGIATCYDFFKRVSPGPHRRYALRRRSARRLRLRFKPGEKLPPRRHLLKRLIRRLLHDKAVAAQAVHPGSLWNELLVRTVAGSVERGIIPHQQALTFAGDGTILESGCHSHGQKTCACPKLQPCDHPRRYTDPGALNGWDSYRNRWVIGRAVYTLVETESRHDLPLWLTLGPANRHDSLSAAMAVHWACRRYADTGIVFRRGLFDAAHGFEPLLQLCYHHKIDPISARNKPAKPKSKVAKRLAKEGIKLSQKGVPVCQAGLPMRSRGHSKPHVWAWSCPNPGQCPTLCRFAQHTLCLNALEDPRALTPTPTATPVRKELFKRRTSVERWHAWLDRSEVQNARHRRDYLWWGRLGLAALASHFKIWAGDLPDGWIHNTLLAPT